MESVLDFARKRELLRAGDRVAVAVSAGADSVALLRMMLDLREEAGIVLSVAHLNHLLRGAESDADEEFVRKLAARFDLECHVERRDVRANASEGHFGIEAVARGLRYEFFGRLIRSGTANTVATAHTADDQAETVLLRLLRGTGFRGLGGIRLRLAAGAAEGRGQIVRPLLRTSRTAVREYLSAIGQDWREDSSNKELKFARNRVRQLLIPLIEKEFNPGIISRLADLAQIAQGEEELWEERCRELRTQMAAETGRELVLDLRHFGKLPGGMQRRLIQSFEDLGLTLEFRHVEEIISLAAGEPKAGTVILPCGWKAVRAGAELRLRFAEQKRGHVTDYEYRLEVPGSVMIRETNVAIEASFTNGAGAGGEEHLADPRKLPRPLVVRPWRAGERFRPQHSKETKKIKELLQDRHITGDAKKLWPVVASGAEIVWVRGLGVSEDFRSRDGQGISILEQDSTSVKTLSARAKKGPSVT